MLKKQKTVKLSFVEEQRLKYIEKIKWKFRAVVARIIFIIRFGVHNIHQKLDQQNINLHNLEDLEFTKTLLKKQVRTQQEVEFLKKSFENIYFFSKHQEDLSPEIYEKLLHKIGYYRKRRHEILFQYGQRDQQLYIILQGSITVLAPNKSLFDKIQNQEITSWDIKRRTMKQFIIYHNQINERKTWHSNKKDLPHEDFQQLLQVVFEDFDRAKDMSYGDSFGEMAAINHSQRSATVICKEDCQFITIDGNSFDQILRIQEKYTLKNKLSFLKDINSINPIHENRKNDLLHSIRQVKYRLFDIIHREGEPADNLYYIFSGDVELSRKSKQDQQNKLLKSETVRISLCTKCSIFGFDTNQSVYQLTAICHTRRCELFVLSREMYKYCVQVGESRGEGRDQWRIEQIKNSDEIAQLVNDNRNYPTIQSKEQLLSSPNKIELTVQKYNSQILKKNQINNRLLQINNHITPRTFLNDSELQQIHHNFKQKIDAIKQGLQFVACKAQQHDKRQLKQKTDRSIEIIVKQKSKVMSQSNIMITQVPNQDQSQEQEIKFRIRRSQSQQAQPKVPYSTVNEFKESLRPQRPVSDESSKKQSSARKHKRVLYQPVLRRVNEQKRQQLSQLIKDIDSHSSIKQKPSKNSYSGIVIMMQRRQQVNINEMNSILS